MSLTNNSDQLKIIAYLIASLIGQILINQFETNITELITYYGIIIISVQLFDIIGQHQMHKYSCQKALEWEAQQWKKYTQMDQPSKEKDRPDAFQKLVERASRTIVTKYSWVISISIKIFSSVVSLIYVVATNKQTNLLMTIILINIFWYYLFTRNLLMKLNDIRKQRRLEKNTLNSLLSLFVVRLHNNETSTETVIDRKKQFYDSDYQAFSQWEITTKIQQLPNYIVFIIIPFFADKDVFLILYIIFNNFNKTLSTAINYFNQWQTMDDDMKAIDDFWNTKNFHSMPRQYNIPDSLIAQGNIKNIVSFSNIVINVGDRIRISGETGSGKTTLIKGLIGHEIGVKYNSNCNPLSYIDNIAYMRQDAREHTPIENTTIRQLFYDEDDDNLIFECLRDTTLMHWFKNTIKDLNIAIASRISGGEKTKLCLAITLYQLKKHNKKWLILDEPEQGLDPELAPQVLQKIFNNCTDVTIFIITHLCECRINELGITTIWNVKNGFIYF